MAGAGSGAGADLSTIAGGAVPEPSSMVLAGLATLMATFVVRRRSQ